MGRGNEERWKVAETMVIDGSRLQYLDEVPSQGALPPSAADLLELEAATDRGDVHLQGTRRPRHHVSTGEGLVFKLNTEEGCVSKSGNVCVSWVVNAS